MNEAADFKSAVSTYFTTQAKLKTETAAIIAKQKSPQIGSFQIGFMEARPGVEPG